MPRDLSQWTETMWRVLSGLPAEPEAVASQRRRWEDLRDRAELRTVVFGAYDAGKSTLLKRLLVEAGTSVPEWLTVSGRRETFEVRSIESEGIVFVDTPGLSGGNAEHERISLDEMQLADAYLWVLPPQLVTSNKQAYLDFASGRYFGNGLPAPIVADATVAAIARMDEAGIDPEDNPDGFCELAARKAAELPAILHAGGVEADLRAVMCVAADPFQMVGTDPAPERDFYDHSRDWDGVEALTRSLRSMCTERESLRAFAGARFVAGLAHEARKMMTNMITENEYKLKACANEVEHHRLSEQRLNALQRQATADLHRRVEEELLHASRMGAESAADVAQKLEDSLSRAIDEWSDSSLDDLRRLAAEFESEVQDRMARPSMAGFRRFHEHTVQEASDSEQRHHVDAKKIGRLVLGFVPALRKAFDAYARSELGIDLNTAADRLQKIEASGKPVKDFIKTQGQQASFRSTAHAEKASRLVGWGNAMDKVGPLVVQLGDLLFEAADEITTAKRAQKRAQRRSDLMEQLRQETVKIENQATSDFDGACDELRQWLHQRITTFENEQAALKRRIGEIRAGAQRTATVLQSFPAETWVRTAECDDMDDQ